MTNRMVFRGAFCLLILLNLGLTISGIFFFKHEVPDSHTYLEFAERMTKDGELYWGSELGLFRTPGYPALISLVDAFFAGNIRLMIGLQALMSLAIAWLCFLILEQFATQRIRTPRVKVGAILCLNAALLLDSTYFFTTFSVLSESLFTLLVLFAAFLSFSPDIGRNLLKVILVGLVLGFAALVKPIGQFLVISFALFFLFRKRTRRILPIGALVLGFSLVTGPWVYRNMATFGFSGLSSVGSFNLVYYRSSAVLAAAHNQTMEEVNSGLAKRFPQQTMNDSQAASMKDFGVRTLSEHLKVLAIQTLRAISMFFFDPGGAYIAQGFSCMNSGSGILSSIMVKGFTESLAFIMTLNGFSLLFLFWSVSYLTLEYIGIGLVFVKMIHGRKLVAARQANEFFIAMLFITAPIVLLSLGPETTARFRVPLLPFLLITCFSQGWIYVQRFDESLARFDGKRSAIR